MQNELKPGDLVRLNSGGPLMTVGQAGGQPSEWRCYWFDKTDRKQADFPEVALERAEKAIGNRAVSVKY
ncbi:YodC family protein [Paracoccus sp. SCSIO 75233]|uniref:YodC family protein n=1 Tax=Paracoccus sp. SCSIO 75233 TaxID=3017782 RepID=UPI0022F0AA97|nr:DUF2158 domain-containing protein [Paracoccus sp. SCSIO 75233]WBU53502.1 DUF2158 domain-containing protein [Paracoccus sp. SCSIO 75233]